MRPIPSRQRSSVSRIYFYHPFMMTTWHFLVISEHLVQMKLAEEVEEREQEANVGIDASSDEDHPSVVILNGLRLEEDQYVYSFLNAWIHGCILIQTT